MPTKKPKGSSPTPPEKAPDKAEPMTSTFYREDLQRLADAESFVRSNGRKGETALTLRTMMHRAELDARFLELYDQLHAKDPRRAKRNK